MVYLKPWHIQYQKQLSALTILASYNYFRNISLCPLVHEINMIFSMQVLFLLQKSLSSLSKTMEAGVEGSGTINFTIKNSNFMVERKKCIQKEAVFLIWRNIMIIFI